MSIKANFTVSREIIDDATRSLQQLIRIPTLAGEGREIDAANLLFDKARKIGLNCRVEQPKKGLGSFIAKIAGECDENLLLLSHLDVAPVRSPQTWRYPPFRGEVAENAIWGRGAIDCKGLVVAWLMVLQLLHHLAIPLRRGVVMVAAADEESGGKWGTQWLLENAPDVQTCQWALNEGGGYPLQFGKRRFLTCQTGEKGYAYLRWKSPHQRIRSQRFTLKASPTASHQRLATTLLPEALGRFPRLASPLIRHLQRNAPYRLNSDELWHDTVEIRSTQTGVELHLRGMPGVEIRQVIREVTDRLKLLEDAAVDFSAFSGTESPLDTDLYCTIEQVFERFQPGVKLIPHITPGYSDSRFLRQHGIPVYGFFPLPFPTPITSQHGPNECLELTGFRRAIEILFSVVYQFCR